MDFVCVKCHKPLESTDNSNLTTPFECCQIAYFLEGSNLKYTYEEILFKAYKKHYLLNRVLNNNAFLAYHFDDRSFSYSHREDVQGFRRFIEKHSPSGSVLDIGCGSLELPGYLEFENKAVYDIHGLDPIDDFKFEGTRVVGCSEFMPYADDRFDAVVFGTSLDHTCSMKDSLKEACRVLKKGGKMFIWMGDVSKTPWQRFKYWVQQKKQSIRSGYPVDRYRVWGPEGNNLVFYIPNGAKDPFHSYLESPGETTKIVTRLGLKQEEAIEYVTNGYYLCFRKGP